jgi:hypothetical protein
VAPRAFRSCRMEKSSSASGRSSRRRRISPLRTRITGFCSGGNEIGDLMGDHDFLGPTAAAPPGVDRAKKLRMQRAALARDDDLKKDHPASWKQERVSLRLRGCLIGPPVRAVHPSSTTGALYLSACLIPESARRFPCHSVCRRNGTVLPIFARRCSLRREVLRLANRRVKRSGAKNLDQVIRH